MSEAIVVPNDEQIATLLKSKSRREQLESAANARVLVMGHGHYVEGDSDTGALAIKPVTRIANHDNKSLQATTR